MTTLAKAWRWWRRDVIGLAPTAVAADELGQAIDMPAETIAKFLHSAMAAASDGRVAAFPPIGPRTLVVIDEAGMVGPGPRGGRRPCPRARGQRPPGRGRPAADRGRREWCLPRPGRAGLCAGDDRPPHRTPPLLRRGGGGRDLGIRSGDPAALGALLLAGSCPRRGRRRRRRPGIQRQADLAAGDRACSSAASRDTVRGLNELARDDRLASQSGRSGRRPRSPTALEPVLGTSSSRGTTTAHFAAATGHG